MASMPLSKMTTSSDISLAPKVYNNAHISLVARGALGIARMRIITDGPSRSF